MKMLCMSSHSAVLTKDSEKQTLWWFGGSLLLVEVVYPFAMPITDQKDAPGSNNVKVALPSMCENLGRSHGKNLCITY